MKGLMPKALRLAFQSRIDKWLDRRIPAQHQHQLGMTSIFIFPSRFGWLFLVLCLCLFLLGTNYQNNLMLILCYLMIALFLLNLHAAYWNFARLRLRLKAIHNGYALDHGSICLSVSTPEQTRKCKGTIHVSEYTQPTQHTLDCETADQFDLPIQLPKRGIHRFPRLTISSYYPLGLYRCWTHLDFNRYVTVYPKPQPSRLKIQWLEDAQQGERGFKSEKGQDDFSGLKPYQPGDSLHRVAWKHVAKHQAWQSKAFDSDIAASGWLTLPTVNAADLELELSYLADQVNQCSQNDIQFGLELGKVQIPPASGEGHRIECLTALAAYPKTLSSGHHAD